MTDLLADKRIPPARLAGALALLAFIVCCYALLLSYKWRLLEETLEGKAAADMRHLLIIPLLPLSAALLLVMIIPIFMYITNYAALQSFVLPRPDHYFRLLVRVYSAWASEGGKLKDKHL